MDSMIVIWGKRDGNTTQEPMALVEEGEYDIENEILQERPIKSVRP